jgi:type III secretion protein T
MEHFLPIYVLGFARCFGFLQALPLVGELEFPFAAKMGVICAIVPFLGLNLFTNDLGGSFSAVPHLDGTLLLLVGKEVLVGLFIGFLVGLPLRLAQTIADFIDNQRGAAQNAQFNPSLGEETGILGQLLTLSLLTYFFSENGFELLVGILAGSYQIISATGYEFVYGDGFFATAMFVINSYMHYLTILALPFVAIMLLVDMGFGMSSRFASSLNVSFLNQSVKSWIALALLLSLYPRIFAGCMALFAKTSEIFL